MLYSARKYNQQTKVRPMAMRPGQTKQKTGTPLLRKDNGLQATTRKFRHGMITTAA